MQRMGMLVGKQNGDAGRLHDMRQSCLRCVIARYPRCVIKFGARSRRVPPVFAGSATSGLPVLWTLLGT